jgi:hypothetical protein
MIHGDRWVPVRDVTDLGGSPASITVRQDQPQWPPSVEVAIHILEPHLRRVPLYTPKPPETRRNRET